MSFSPRNVSQLLAGETVMASKAAYIAASAVGDYLVQAIPDPNTSSGELANLGARVMVRTNGGDKVSDKIVLSNISSITSGKVLVVGSQKDVTVTYQTPADFNSKTFTCIIDIHDNIGSMLNDRFLSAYVVTDAAGKFLQSDGTLVTATLITVGAEIASLLTSTVNQSNDLFTVAADGAGVITITQVAEKQVVGVKDGINLPFEIIAQMKEGDVSNQSLSGVPAVQVITEGKIDELVQMKNIEWFNSGYDKDPYREMGYPASFATDSNITTMGIAIGDAYTVIQFYKDRDATNIERQHRQLILVGALATSFEAALAATTV